MKLKWRFLHCAEMHRTTSVIPERNEETSYILDEGSPEKKKKEQQGETEEEKNYSQLAAGFY